MILDPLRACDADVRWSARVADLRTGELDRLEPQRVLPTASVGKLFLLLTVAERLERGVLDAGEVLAVHDDDHVADSGLLQFLSGRHLTVGDLALLVGAVSDNLATNVLLRRVGLAAVHDMTAGLGVSTCALNDRVRAERIAGQHPPTLSQGSAGELSDIVTGLADGSIVSSSVAATVRRWLSVDTDVSMVASAFGFDPLAHTGVDPGTGLHLFNKTGTDEGTRADVGVVGTATSRVAYAVVAHWDGDDLVSRLSVLDAMRGVGAAICRHLVAR